MVGHNAQNRGSLNLNYICRNCSLIYRDPVQLIDCGHRLCSSCADEQNGDLITCPECYEKTPRSHLVIDRGFKNDTLLLLIICSLCDWTGVLKTYQNHLDQMHPNPVCAYCGEQLASVNDLNRHHVYTCEKMMVYCALKQFGCEEMILRIDLSNHYRTEQHQRTIMNVARYLKETEHPRTIETPAIHIEEINETIGILSDGLTVLNDDCQRLKTESFNHHQTFESFIKNSSKVKISVQEQNGFLDGLKINQETLVQDLTLMGQKLNDMKMCPCDGTLTWKLTNVQEKIIAAQSETQTSIYSPPFYSSPNGYKMCLRLYLNGDGNARGTHMSLFFVLMRGEYDAILKFPFDFKMIFCLYDQTNQKKHIIDAFRPDIRSNSFQRPRSDMNIASGIPKLVSVNILQQENNPYIRDDTMFIKAMLDFGNMSKAVLTYALNLNPGLTTPIQQAMIRQETERQQQS